MDEHGKTGDWATSCVPPSFTTGGNSIQTPTSSKGKKQRRKQKGKKPYPPLLPCWPGNLYPPLGLCMYLHKTPIHAHVGTSTCGATEWCHALAHNAPTPKSNFQATVVNRGWMPEAFNLTNRELV